MEEDKTIEERKKKLIDILKKRWLWTAVFLIIALMLGFYIRSLPMQDHSKAPVPFFKFVFMPWSSFEGRAGLLDVTTNKWTLGPDLDPWLFQRYAKEMIDGSFSKVDGMRNVPLGFDTTLELQMVPYMIVITYKIINAFGSNDINLAGVLMPVLLFLLTIIAFFLFVKEIFDTKSEEGWDNKIRANIIALISTFFMIVIPVFLSRTVAGIPEKESVGFFFMFAAFYFILKSWKSQKLKHSIIFAILSGVATALMGLTWGGVIYIYVTIAVATIVAFLLNKVGKKESIVYILWILTSLVTTFLFTTKYSLKSFVTSIDTGLATFALFIIIFHIILWSPKISKIVLKIKFFNQTKIPRNVLSLIIGIVILLILASIILGPGFFLDKLAGLNRTMFNPTMGRWSTTVAENRQPYFKEWASEFGPFLKNLPNLPIMFWLFFVGSVVLFRSLLNKIDKKDAWILTGLYVLFFFGLVFSRYAPHPAFLDGEDFISKGFYIGSALLLVLGLIYYYIKYEKEGNKGLEIINYNFLLLFSLFILCLFTARSAVRLIMVLGPIAPIFVGYLIVESFDRFKKSKDETWKIVVGAFMILILITSIFSFYSYYQSTRNQAYIFIPSYYNQQWQKAMKWVRDETPKNAVFAHWWDYGYWVQSIGDRATVTDGGNAIVYWNYLMGRFVLTGDNQKDSLEFLYNHNASYLLIDSSDIGKYGAFSSIGSDKNFDKYSWIGTFLMDEKQTQETKNETLYVYVGGIALDEDLIINETGKSVLLPSQKTGIGIIVLPLKNTGNEIAFGQPYVLVQYNGITHKIDMKYLSVEGKFIDFKTGIEACAYVFPRIDSTGDGKINENKLGAVMFLSPRLLRGYLAQKYILNDPFKKFSNFKVAYKEQSLIVDSLNSQGMNLPDLVYFQGVQGPITIWEISYTGNEKINPEYTDWDYTKYLDWEL